MRLLDALFLTIQNFATSNLSQGLGNGRCLVVCIIICRQHVNADSICSYIIQLREASALSVPLRWAMRRPCMEERAMSMALTLFLLFTKNRRSEPEGVITL